MIPRKLSILDKDRLIVHLTSLQGEDRRLRFGAGIGDEAIASYVSNSFKQDSKWFGVDHIDGHLVAACHVAIVHGEAELGCSVDAHFRGQKLAQSLLDRAVTFIKSRGINTVFMHCLTENNAMRHIAKKNNMHVQSEYGETDARVEVDGNPMSIIEDAYLDRVALYDMLFRNQLRAWNVLNKMHEPSKNSKES